MDQSDWKRLIRIALVVWLLVTALLFIGGRASLVMGASVGVLIALINFKSLITTIKKRQQTKQAALETRSLTLRFMLRYVALAVVFMLVVQSGMHHLMGFMIGFAAIYLALFVNYLLSKRKAVRDAPSV